MKKVEKVSIGRYAFTLYEEAYRKASEYLDELNNYYSKRESGHEVMEGIEERMAELLLEKCGPGGIVSAEMIEEVISILGRPEVIEDADSDSSGSNLHYNAKKKLFRDPSSKILGGVSSGLAAYFNIETALVRVIWLVLWFIFSSAGAFTLPVFGGAFIPIVYIIMWIVIPPAKTVQQRCQMRGEDGTLGDLEKNISKGADYVGRKAREIGNSDFWRVLGRALGIIIGIILLIIGVSGLMVGALGLFGITFFNTTILNLGLDWLSEYAPVFALNVPMMLLKIVTMLVVFMPFLGMLYGGIQLIFGFKPPRWRPGLIIFIIWLISLIALVVLGLVGIFSVG
ncbi:MAG: PspC domain-containing protein [Bacteroidales bacterium]|jgi:phage shock protein PspC (stress-responsive transcriptional regulator)|nr:PspC domain-containing protein [Bacteroidales bacterium]